jgi:hypothetical protein
MTAINQNFSMFAGNTKQIIVSVDDAENLTGATIEFNARRDENSPIVIRKTDILVEDNTLTIILNPNDTKNLTGTYDYWCDLTDEYGDVTTLFVGTITLNRGGGGILAQQVFITAMNLMDEESEDGTFEGYPDEYKKKAWPLLTMLQAELTPASKVPSLIVDENGTFSLDDRTVLTALPYGLAAQLLLNEDQNRAAYFNNRYDELKRKRPAVIGKIQDVYGITPGQAEAPTVLTTTADTQNGDVIDGGEW